VWTKFGLTERKPKASGKQNLESPRNLARSEEKGGKQKEKVHTRRR